MTIRTVVHGLIEGEAMSRAFCIVVLAAGLLVAFPMFAADGNIYLTGHDVDFHCALQPAPTQCNALKIAIALARAGAPDPSKKVLFLDEGMSASTASALGFAEGTSELALAAAQIGLPSTAYQVVSPTSVTFTGNSDADPPVAPLALNTSSYSAIVFASDETCGGCDNTSGGETNINNRSSDIASFFSNGGGLAYLSSGPPPTEGSTIYYNSVPPAYAVNSTTTPNDFAYTLTPAGKSLGLSNDDATCCETHNSFAAPIIIEAPTLESATNSKLISAELDSNGRDE